MSRIKLDTSKRDTQIALAAPSRLHGAIESSFCGERTRKLWRIDYLKGECFLLLLSENIPDCTKLQEQFGFENELVESKDYQPLLNRIIKQSIWHFRLIANPVRHIYKDQGNRKRGKVSAHVSEKYLLQWLTRKATENGFCIEEEKTTVKQIRWYSFKKAGTSRPIKFKAVSYEGILEVEDPAAFCNVLVNGLGREKAYGMGMLTIVRR